jgi:pyrrolidone-carboxylate peptidase
MFILEGNNAIHRMYRLKHRIRHEIWGRKFEKGGFLHAPDSPEEARNHESIISRRIIQYCVTAPNWMDRKIV